MKRSILIGFLGFAMLFVPRMAFAAGEPTNLKATVSGGDIKLTWTAPATLPVGVNAYAIFMQTTPIDPIVYPVTSNEGYVLSPMSEPIGITQHSWNSMINRTFYFTVGTGNCTQKDGYCEFSSYGNFSPVISVKVEGGVGDLDPLLAPFQECKNTAGLLHAYDCTDRVSGGAEERHNVACLKGYVDRIEDIYHVEKLYHMCVPDPKLSTLTSPTCVKPLVSYLGSCVDEISACKNPPSNSTNCIDRVKDGALIERDMFMCISGFSRQGKECVYGVGNGNSVAPGDEEAVDEQEISEGQPDLMIKVAKATLVKRTFKGGVTKKQYKFGVTVKNEGDADADGPISIIFSNSVTSAPVLVTKGILVAGKSKKVFVYVDISEKGKKLTFTVDPDNAVDESNEDNNTATRVVGK